MAIFVATRSEEQTVNNTDVKKSIFYQPGMYTIYAASQAWQTSAV